jgi:hypothetical protein
MFVQWPTGSLEADHTQAANMTVGQTFGAIPGEQGNDINNVAATYKVIFSNRRLFLTKEKHRNVWQYQTPHPSRHATGPNPYKVAILLEALQLPTTSSYGNSAMRPT